MREGAHAARRNVQQVDRIGGAIGGARPGNGCAFDEQHAIGATTMLCEVDSEEAAGEAGAEDGDVVL